MALPHRSQQQKMIGLPATKIIGEYRRINLAGIGACPDGSPDSRHSIDRRSTHLACWYAAVTTTKLCESRINIAGEVARIGDPNKLDLPTRGGIETASSLFSIPNPDGAVKARRKSGWRKRLPSMTPGVDQAP